jgi:prolyl-tRNA editing enzyme YbaK/EbsC (Cys-tRNA(Pro) deacylase)
MVDDDSLPSAARRVQGALEAAGVRVEIHVTKASARSAREAADALGIGVAQIAKSLIFRGRDSGRAVLVIAAGDNRVDEAKLEREIGEKIERADAAFVRAATGFAIGGVPPIVDSEVITVLCDETLARFDEVWAAAGTPHTVFPISPQELFRVSKGRVADVREA